MLFAKYDYAFLKEHDTVCDYALDDIDISYGLLITVMNTTHGTAHSVSMKT
jgi:hypothetical protein